MTHMMLSAAVSEYTELTYGRYAKATRASQTSILNMFMRRQGDLQVRHLTQAHMERYFYAHPHGLRHRYEPSTFNQHRTIIIGLVKFMLNRGWLRTDPMFNVRPAAVTEKERTRLSAYELLGILDKARHPRDRAFLVTAMNTGLRVGEIQGLTIGDLDLDSGTLHTRLSKNHKEDSFPINTDFDREMRRWLTWYTARAGRPEPSWFLLPAKNNVPINLVDKLDPADTDLRPLDPMLYPARLMAKLRAELGITTAGEGVHMFRRSIARLYYDQMLTESGSRDDALRLTQAFLNHSTAAMTERYLGLSKERQRRDASLRGQPFLSAMTDSSNVVPILRGAHSGEGQD